MYLYLNFIYLLQNCLLIFPERKIFRQEVFFFQKIHRQFRKKKQVAFIIERYNTIKIYIKY